jgi:hypothetical protein
MSFTYFHIERKRAATEVYRALKLLSEEKGEIPISPIRLASIAAGGASPRQIYRWLNEDLTDEGQTLKKSQKGPYPLLSDDQELLVVGFTISCRLSLVPVTLSSLSDFCKSYLNLEVSNSKLSRIMNRHGFSNQKVLGRNSRMVDEKVVEDALAAVEEIRSFNFPPELIISMDETGLWSNVINPRTYHFKSWCARIEFLISYIFVNFHEQPSFSIFRITL